MYRLVTDPANQVIGQRADSLSIGDLAEIVDGSSQRDIVLWTFSGLVSLSNPRQTWESPCSLRVRRLNSGTKVHLTVQD
ncbi:hypothetical protein LCGC14_2363720 [marine sediment metagenome]|uniref:Uncharacterized protein n=1 Tax=marine sediment metagenome TaxID=412755 RepID=A0A0F9F0K3_9ZZZZ